ncbi:hypothetical protein DPX16_1603 [Anabarilius grahami]|uniref:Uncharacterized protein n=1 Tax=Anabarilius grahami TaxID=495550 RepID=A0A3N0Z8E2_ANAGA|nr:hypothetical protein DPX16_1603 [Anabarilius grahami]
MNSLTAPSSVILYCHVIPTLSTLAWLFDQLLNSNNERTFSSSPAVASLNSSDGPIRTRTVSELYGCIHHSSAHVVTGQTISGLMKSSSSSSSSLEEGQSAVIMRPDGDVSADGWKICQSGWIVQ